MYRANLPAELDSLDSPLFSATPLPSATLGSIPGSALAERIFNDPHSWETEGVDDDFLSDPVAWFVEEIEKFRLNSAASSTTVFSVDMEEEEVSAMLSEKGQLVLPPPEEKRKSVRKSIPRPISLAAFFEQSGEELQAHLSKIIDSGGAPPGVTKPLLSSFLTPPLTGSSTPETPEISASRHSAASTESSSLASPSPLYSASATLSFLEWYGIHPDSPRGDGNMRKSIYTKTRLRGAAPAIQIPAAQYRPISISSPSLSHPDLTVVPPVRDISVPHLPNPVPQPIAVKPAKTEPVVQPSVTPSLKPAKKRQAAPKPSPRVERPVKGPSPRKTPPIETPVKQPPPKPTPPVTPEVRPQTPPGLARGNSLPRSLPNPQAAPPPYSRTPSPLHSLLSRSESASPSPSRTPPHQQSSSPIIPASASVRRLPSIPQSAATPPPPQTSLPTSIPSSIPTSMLSPEPPHAQTIVYNSRPHSAARSPLGGPAGPRTRSSSGSPFASHLQHAPRPSSGLARRPPVLQL